MSPCFLLTTVEARSFRWGEAGPGSSKETPHTSHGPREAWRHLPAQLHFSLPQDTANTCTFPVPVAKKNQSAPMLPFIPTNTVHLFIPGEQDLLIYVNWDCTGRYFPSTSPCIPLRNQTDFIISYSSQQPAGTPTSACKACWQAAFFFSPPHEEFCAFWQFWRLTELWLQFSYVLYIYICIHKYIYIKEATIPEADCPAAL